MFKGIVMFQRIVTQFRYDVVTQFHYSAIAQFSSSLITLFISSSRSARMGIHERLGPCVARARALNGDDLFRSRALLNIAADCGKCFPSLVFQLFLKYVVRSYIVA